MLVEGNLQEYKNMVELDPGDEVPDVAEQPLRAQLRHQYEPHQPSQHVGYDLEYQVPHALVIKEDWVVLGL